MHNWFQTFALRCIMPHNISWNFFTFSEFHRKYLILHLSATWKDRQKQKELFRTAILKFFLLNFTTLRFLTSKKHRFVVFSESSHWEETSKRGWRGTNSTDRNGTKLKRSSRRLTDKSQRLSTCSSTRKSRVQWKSKPLFSLSTVILLFFSRYFASVYYQNCIHLP